MRSFGGACVVKALGGGGFYKRLAEGVVRIRRLCLEIFRLLVVEGASSRRLRGFTLWLRLLLFPLCAEGCGGLGEKAGVM